MNPLVSIVIPLYNGEKFISETLTSALNQTYRDIEIVVVNDGSTDNGMEIVNGLSKGDKRIRAISQSNQGVASARNAGSSYSRGEYIAYLDADDLWHSRKIERQVALMENNRRLGACYCLYRRIDERGVIYDVGVDYSISGPCLAQHLVTKPVANGSSLLIKRELHACGGGFDSSYALQGIGGCEDLDFELKVAAVADMACVPSYLVGYRSHPDCMSNNELRISFGLLELLLRALDRHPELPGYMRSWALGLAYRSLAVNQLRSRSIIPGILSLFSALFYDPAVFSERFYERIWGLFMEDLRRHQNQSAKAIVAGRCFYDCDPDALRKLPSPFINRRLKRLQRWDRREGVADYLHCSKN